MYSPAKAAQMAAFFVSRQGGWMDVLKLIKLLYLADRESLRRYGEPISYDYLVAMPHGPVLTRVLDLVNGSADPAASAAWDEWISDRENHRVSLCRDVTPADLDQLSPADADVLDAVWREFGHMDKWTLRDWTHDHCSEWTDPHGSSRSIDDASVLRALGRSEEEASELARRIQAQRAIDATLARL